MVVLWLQCVCVCVVERAVWRNKRASCKNRVCCCDGVVSQIMHAPVCEDTCACTASMLSLSTYNDDLVCSHHQPQQIQEYRAELQV
jgi:hypothetical protein